MTYLHPYLMYHNYEAFVRSLGDIRVVKFYLLSLQFSHTIETFMFETPMNNTLSLCS